MKTLKDYLANATHFLNPFLEGKKLEEQRKTFLDFCEAFGLDKDFEEQVSSNPEWQKLAETETVSFFVDVYQGRSPSVSLTLPSIRIFCAVGSTIPVVKLMLDKRKQYWGVTYHFD